MSKHVWTTTFAPALRQSLPPVASTSRQAVACLSTTAKRCIDSPQTPVAHSSTTTSAPPSPRWKPIKTPDAFIEAIGKPRRGDLKSVLSAMGEEPDMQAMLKLRGEKLKQAGVPVKERRYFLWCLERFRQGQHPLEIAYDVKPKKKIRGWGPRVQNGKRIRGMRKPGEK